MRTQSRRGQELAFPALLVWLLLQPGPGTLRAEDAAPTLAPAPDAPGTTLAPAADAPGTGALSAPAEKPPQRFSILPVPTFGYSPETRFYGGAVALMTFRLFDDPRTRTSNLEIEVSATQNRQRVLETAWELFFLEDRYVFSGELTYQRYPENYYGIGADTRESAAEPYDVRRLELEASPRMQVIRHGFAGPAYRLQRMSQLEPMDGGLLAEGRVAGASGGISSGLGYRLMWDSRDNVLNPSAGGQYLSATHLFFGEVLGSDFGFTRLELDARAYLRTWRRHVLALQAFAQLHTGTPPFRMLALLGGETIMRGYYYGRYRDQHLVAAQAEYRLPVFWRLGLVAFAGAGNVIPRLGALPEYTLKPSAGGGVRLLVDKDEQVNLRMDFAVGRGTNGFYISFGEAF